MLKTVLALSAVGTACAFGGDQEMVAHMAMCADAAKAFWEDAPSFASFVEGASVTWHMTPPVTATTKEEAQAVGVMWGSVADWNPAVGEMTQVGTMLHFQVDWTGTKSRLNGHVIGEGEAVTMHVADCAAMEEHVWSDFTAVLSVLGAMMDDDLSMCAAAAKAFWEDAPSFESFMEGSTVTWHMTPPVTATTKEEAQAVGVMWGSVADWNPTVGEMTQVGSQLHFQVDWTGTTSRVNGHVIGEGEAVTMHIADCAAWEEHVWSDFTAVLSALGA